jgi:hypothetical protein
MILILPTACPELATPGQRNGGADVRNVAEN